MKYEGYYIEQIINYVTNYLINRYGSGDSVTNRNSYISIIAHIMSNHKISYIKIDANWPRFYLSEIIPKVLIGLREWLQKSGTHELNQHTKLLIEMMADRILANVIYDTYLKHLSFQG